MHIWHNMHTHTRLCYCGGRDSTVANTVTEAESIGLRLVGISDHIDAPGSRREEMIQQNRDELAQIDTDVEVLIGAEISLNAPGSLPVPDEYLARLDYFLISANHYHLNVVQNPEKRTEQGYADWFLIMVESAISLGASIIPHPFYYIGVRTLEGGRAPDRQVLLDSYDRSHLEDVFGLAGERGTAFELNPPSVETCPDFFVEIVPMARAHGVKFAVGSDGHHPGSMNYGGPDKVERFEEFLGSLGIEDSDICPSFAPRLI
jgi:histidinol phosphatase-like PHP family hydrolase